MLMPAAGSLPFGHNFFFHFAGLVIARKAFYANDGKNRAMNAAEGD
jgi:hypothetical protein